MKQLLQLLSFLTLTLFFTQSPLFAQFPMMGGGGGKGQRGGRAAMPFDKRLPIGTITGRIIDTTTNKKVEFASVALYWLKKDSLITGALSDKGGYFTIDKVRPAMYKLKVDFIGYESKVIPMIRPKRGGGGGKGGFSFDVDLGNIYVAPSNIVMDAVEVTADASFMQSEIDKKVYRADKVTAAVGGTATEILEQIPSVEVDIDGNVSLRGSSNVTVLIDGRPSGLTGADRAAIIEQLPADAIDKIEVISNPSAKYDPDGMAGIINIVLKKNRKLGLNGNVTVGAGTSPNANGSVSLNYRDKKINVFSNYSYRYNDRWRKGETIRSNELPNLETGLLETIGIDQFSFADQIRHSNVIRGGVDYYINPKSTIGIAGTFSLNNNKSDQAIDYTYSNEGIITSTSTRDNQETTQRSSGDVTLSYEKQFSQPEQKLTASANYSIGQRAEEGDFMESGILTNTNEIFSIPLERNDMDNQNQIVTLQTDYVHPFNEDKSTIEVGYKSIFRNLQNDFVAERFEDASNMFVNNTDLSNEFEYNEQIHALYALYGQKIGSFSFKAGIRMEQALTDFTLITTNEDFENNYFSVFPSLFLAQKIGKTQEIKASYTRRINRPRTRQLNPFADRSDPLNLRFGNPRLNPEYVDVFEVGYERFFKFGTLSSSVYYRWSHDLMSRVKTVNEEGVSTLTYTNFSEGRSIGVELIGMLRPTKWLTVSTSFNLYKNEVDGSNFEDDFTADAFAWNARAFGNLKLWKGGAAQLSVFYSAPRQIPQGEISYFFITTASLKQTFLNKKASVSLSIRDIPNLMRFKIDIGGPNFSQQSEFRRKSRIANINFTYRFGQQDRSRRRGKFQREGGGGGGFDDMEF